MASIVQTPTFSSKPYFYAPESQDYAQSSGCRIQPHSKPVVDYFFPKEAGDYHYGWFHPMKPQRLTITNTLILGYGLHKHMGHCFNPRAATRDELEQFHDSDYVDFLSQVTPRNQALLVDRLNNPDLVSDDCPVFAGLYDFCRQYTGASLMAARRLAHGATDIAINWTGGLHHAKKSHASGFCYINDIVLAIQELLRYHPRVLYVDIDIHHGDGVEEAFYNSNRVMTVSFHKLAEKFFPGTGKLDDNGSGMGKHFAINVPLADGIDDESYVTLFKAVMDPTITKFRPTAIVLQCGADSLGSDRLGAFNLSIRAHGECIRFIKAYDFPLLILGGGGYTVSNVARCWTYETSVLLGTELPAQLPSTKFDEYFENDLRLHRPIKKPVENQNTRASLEKIRIHIREKLRYLEGAPSVQMQEFPPDLNGWLEDDERTEIKEARKGADDQRTDDLKLINEYFAENEGERNRFVDPMPVSAIEPTTKRAVGKRKSVLMNPKGKSKARDQGEGNRVTFASGVGDDTDIRTPTAAPKRKIAGTTRVVKAKGRAKGKEKAVVADPPPLEDRDGDLDI